MDEKTINGQILLYILRAELIIRESKFATHLNLNLDSIIEVAKMIQIEENHFDIIMKN